MAKERRTLGQKMEDQFEAWFIHVLLEMQYRGKYARFYETAKSVLSKRGLWKIKQRGQAFTGPETAGPGRGNKKKP